MASCRILRHRKKQLSLQSLKSFPWWVTSCSICGKHAARRLVNPAGKKFAVRNLLNQLCQSTKKAAASPYWWPCIRCRGLDSPPVFQAASPVSFPGVCRPNYREPCRLVSSCVERRTNRTGRKNAWRCCFQPGLWSCLWAERSPWTRERKRQNVSRLCLPTTPTRGFQRRGDGPVALEAGSGLGDRRKVARQADRGAEELRRTFSLERRLTFQQNLEQVKIMS